MLTAHWAGLRKIVENFFKTEYNSYIMLAKPFVKWVGGKSQLLEEIREKYALLKLKTKPVMDKGMEKRMVSLFRKYNIIRNLDSDVNQADTRIVIYPSVIMAVTVDDINEYYTMTEKKLKEYSGEKDEEQYE